MKKLLLLPLLFALGACATTSRPVAVDNVPAMDPAMIIDPAWFSSSSERTVPVRIVREPASIGRLMKTMLVVDTRPIAMLQPGRATTLHLAPGPHVFAIGYAKRPETRPLARRELEVRADLRNDFLLRLQRGGEPMILRFSEDAAQAAPGHAATTQARAARAIAGYTLPRCPGASMAALAGEVEGPQSVGARICLGPLSAVLPAAAVPSWSDLGNVEKYADHATVAQVVDDAIRASGLADWVKGKAGRHMDQERRYLYTRRAGWIDLKHVISSASNPGAFVPGLSRMLPWVIEVAQVQVAPMSAFLREDIVSNHLGADAAMRHAAGFGRGDTRGQIVQRAIDRLEPLTLEQALREFGVAAPEGPTIVSAGQAAASPGGN